MLLFIELAAKYIVDNRIIEKWGTGSNAVSDDVAARQRKFIISKFGLTSAQFSEAFEDAQKLTVKA